MDMENKRAKSGPKKAFQKFLFPITIISSILISGSIGYAASQMAIKNNSTDSAEINAMEKEATQARNESIKVIETEIPKIISDLEKYNQDINLLVENVDWLKENLAPVRAATDKFDTPLSILTGVNNFVDLPYVNKIEDQLAFAEERIEKIDDILLHMDNITVIQKEINDSHRELYLLYEEYKKENDIEQLLLIEEELNSNLIYQIEDLKNITMEASEVFELSSSVLVTVNNAKSLYDSIQEKGKNTLDAVQFWKDNKEIAEIETDINKDFKKDLEASQEKVENLPDELALQSLDTVTSINNIQKELQTIKVAQMIISE